MFSYHGVNYLYSLLLGPLKELKKKHGKTPNIVYILWDDMAFGDAGIPALNQIRGFETPNCKNILQCVQ